jgi:DNA-binding beta-propeller fold protein YncE
VTATIHLPHAARVTFWAGSAWISNQPPGTLVRLDPASNRVVGKAVPAGTSPIYLAASSNGLWVIDLTDTGAELLHLASPSAVK